MARARGKKSNPMSLSAADAPIRLKGVRTHNLKNIDVTIPIAKITVVTGRSGAGKSSLVMDTLYAEGQRRYVESLSTYTRQFLQRMDRPDVDEVSGIIPAIAIRQHSYAKNPRSTVGTVTEVYDYLRLLFARLARYRCPDCGELIREDDPRTIWNDLRREHDGQKIGVVAPVTTDPKDPIGQMRMLIQEGLYELWDDGEIIDIRSVSARHWSDQPTRWVWLGARKVEANQRDAWIDQLDLAFAIGRGHLALVIEGKLVPYSQDLTCPRDQRQFPPLEPGLFSFNRPEGACPACQGFGDVAEIDWRKVIPDPDRSLKDHPIKPWNTPGLKHLYRYLFRAAKTCGWPMDVPWRDLPETVKNAIIEGNDAFWGLRYFFDRLQQKRYKRGVRIFLARYRSYHPCRVCGGTRLKPEARWAEVDGLTLPEIVRWPVRRILQWLNRLELSETERQMLTRVFEELRHRLNYLNDVGLGYLTLDRTAGTLSGGEAQRIQMAIALGTALSDTLFVLDEPSAGLHPRDIERLNSILRRLKSRRNTVVVVEHDPDVIREADYILELGPGSGEAGGAVVAEGPPAVILNHPQAITGKVLREGYRGYRRVRPLVESPDFIRLRGAREFNLKSIDVQFPMGCLTVITGVSGSGKSTLLERVLLPAVQSFINGPFPRRKTWESFECPRKLHHVEYIDAYPPTRSPRTTVGSFMDIIPALRTWWVRVTSAGRDGLSPSHFSWNTPSGRCPTCRGLGFQRIEMIFISDVFLTCETCGGKRFHPNVLEYRWNGMSFADLLDRTADSLLEILPEEKALTPARRALIALQKLELGYLKPGLSLMVLSGGEIQRLKLARVLMKPRGRPTLFLFDEPTIGLHPVEIERLIFAWQQLIERGHTMVVVEHHPGVVLNADYLIDLGPEGGEEGGKVMIQGWLPEILRSRNRSSITLRYLRRYAHHVRRSLRKAGMATDVE